MYKISLYDRNKQTFESYARAFSLPEFKRRVDWLNNLPRTKSGKNPYDFTRDFYITFARREDMLAYKLTFPEL